MVTPFKPKMTPVEAANAMIAKLTKSDILYMLDPKRGEYRGFAALHDLMDANMLMPGADDDDVPHPCDVREGTKHQDEDERAVQAHCDWFNEAMTEFNRLVGVV